MTNDTNIKPHLEAIIKRRACAVQMHFVPKYKRAHDLAKDVYEGLKSDPHELHLLAKEFATLDLEIMNSLEAIAAILERQLRLIP
ncbi:MAG: hypothetical protein PHF58_13545 [Methylotenera sp.]|nr:hypothetical protein [Methylotenera sp.]